MSRTTVAARAEDAVDYGEQRVVTLRVFDGHVHRLALLALSEATIVVFCVYAGILLRFGFASTFDAFEHSKGPIWPRALLIAVVFIVALASLGLYQLRQRSDFTGVATRLLTALLLAQVALGVLFYVAPSLDLGRGVMALTYALACIGLAVGRFVFIRLVDEDLFKRRVLVWGAGTRATAIAQRLRRRTDQRGFRIIAYVRTPGDHDALLRSAPVLPAVSDLVRLALQHKVEEIVIAMDDRRAGFPTEQLLECRLRGVQVTDLMQFLERESGRVSVSLMQPTWLIFSKGFRCGAFHLVSKRLFDIAVSIVMLIGSAPIALLTALAIYLEDGRPVFYRQVRVGQNGKRFAMTKFRSMSTNAEADGRAMWAARNDSRVTRVGRVIRLLRIDELPQLFNVLVGDMSFVGPRPERPEFVQQLARRIPFYLERHFVKPGITGWAQVRYSYGASERDAREKLEYDLYYVKHHSLAFDLMVLLQTVEIVLFRVGAR